MVSLEEAEKWRAEWNKELAERQERMDKIMWKSFDNYPKLKAIFTRDRSKPADPNLIFNTHKGSCRELMKIFKLCPRKFSYKYPVEDTIIDSSDQVSILVAAWGWLILTGIMFAGFVLGMFS